jgi:PAS domain-containing protein
MPAYHFSAFAIPPALTVLVVMAFAIVVATTRFSRISVALFTLCIAIAAWKVAFAFMYLAVDAGTAAVWAKVGCACAAFIAPAVYQFVTSLLSPVNHRRIISALGWIGAAQFAILTLTTDHVVARVQRFWWGFYPAYDMAASVTLLLFVAGLLAAALVEIIRAHPQTQGTESKRIRLFTIALGVGYLGVVDFLPVFGIAVYPFGWAAILGFIAIAVYIVAQHGLVPITPSLAANEIIGTMRDLLLVSDREGRIQFANNAACSFLGYNREDIVGHRL